MMGLRTPDYFDLKRDIKAHGLSHRLKACKELGVEANWAYRDLLRQALKSGEQLKSVLIRATSRTRPENREVPAVTDSVAYELEGQLKGLLGSICALETKLRGAQMVSGDEDSVT